MAEIVPSNSHLLDTSYIRPITRSSHIRNSEAELLAQLVGVGIPISESDKQKARISGIEVDGPPSEKESPLLDGRQHLWLTPEQAKAARNRSENPQPKAECYLDRIPTDWKKEWGQKIIAKSDWRPMRPDKLTKDPEFRRFVSSHIPRFDRIIAYKPFWLYIKQALDWLDEGVQIGDFEGEDARLYGLEEMARINENKLYGAIKYGFIKDDTQPGGWRKYHASTPQALLYWAMDCNLSGELGKGRQAAITSSIMLYDALTMLVRSSYKGVLVTDDVEFTGKSIFEEKLKQTIEMLILKNPWMKPGDQPNWGAKKITHSWGGGKSKSEKRTFSSDFTLAASNETQTINGTTPSVVRFDECQNIPTYQDIKLEARPTMLSNINGVLEIVRSLWAWGTGSRKQSGGGSFENEYKGTLQKWRLGDDTSSFIPLFFDRTCRPGITDEDYLREYEFYMSRQDDGMAGMTKEGRMAVFFSAYPNKPEDMFLTSHKHIVPALLISEAWELIEKYCGSKGLPIPGRFEPVFAPNEPMPEGSWYPHKVVGSRWVTMAPDDPDAPCKMFLNRPEGEKWVYRWSQGTDPCVVGSGSSLFASAIYDAAGFWTEENGIKVYHPTVACILNDSKPNMEECFAQCTLMGMYYRNDNMKACPELVENNRGGEYQRWKMSPQFNLSESLIYRAQLPQKYQGGGHQYGIEIRNNSKGSSKTELFFDIVAFVRSMGPRKDPTGRSQLDGQRIMNIWFYDYWTQLYNIEVEEKANQSVQFGTRNKNAFNDDLVYAVQYAFIASQVVNQLPLKLDAVNPEYRWVEVQKLNTRTLEPYHVMERQPVMYV